MPTITRERGFRLFFYSDEGSPLEPCHIHVRNGDGEAKFWVGDEIGLAYNHVLNRRELAFALMIVRAGRSLIERAWNGFFA
jgi:ligand-binding sensor domain-containing protein